MQASKKPFQGACKARRTTAPLSHNAFEEVCAYALNVSQFNPGLDQDDILFCFNCVLVILQGTPSVWGFRQPASMRSHESAAISVCVS